MDAEPPIDAEPVMDAEPVSDAVPLQRRLVAEAIGTGLLVAVVVGSGIMAQTLSPTDTGLQLLENSLTTGLALTVLIAWLGPVSGAHFNPVVTLAVAWWERGSPARWTPAAVVATIAAQVAGGSAGTLLAHAMFADSMAAPALVDISSRDRSSPSLWLSEVVATFGLVVLIGALVRTGRATTLAAPLVGAYIAGAYWWTASTSFANPAVTIARALTDTFAGIQPSSVLPFVLAQLVGAAVAVAAVGYLHPRPAQARTIIPAPLDEHS